MADIVINAVNVGGPRGPKGQDGTGTEPATRTTLGSVIVGTGLNVDSTGLIDATPALDAADSARINAQVALDAAGDAQSDIDSLTAQAITDTAIVEQDDSLVLSVVKNGTAETTPIIEASSTQGGIMPAESFSQIQFNTEEIQKIQQAGLYRGSFQTLADAPTTTPNAAFIGGEITQNDIITVQDATHDGKSGAARYRASVNDGTVTYTFDYFFEEHLMNFSTGQAGLIVGANSDDDGKIFGENDGTGSVVGWDTVKSDIQNNATAIATKITNPSGGTAGQLLTKTATGEDWATFDLSDYYTKTETDTQIANALGTVEIALTTINTGAGV